MSDLTTVERSRRIAALAAAQGRFSAHDAQLAANRILGAEMRAERARLMTDWPGLVATQDFAAIATAAGRLAEIERELARMGV